MEAGDARDLHLVFGDRETMRYLDFPMSRNIAETAKIIEMATFPVPEWHATWSIVLRASRGVIGFVNYHHRESRHRRLEIGCVLSRACWRQGLANEAVRALLGYCFGSLGMHRVEQTIDPENVAAIRLAERLGFRGEGALLRDRILVDGEYRSLLMYSLLDREWRPGIA